VGKGCRPPPTNMPNNKKQNQGGQVCHSLQSEVDWNLFKITLKQADQAAGRKLLPGCSYSAEMLGMWTVARVKAAKIDPRKLAESYYQGGLSRAGVPSVVSSCLPDSPAHMYCLDEIEDLIKAMVDATDNQRTKLAAQAWESAYTGAKDSIIDEGYGDILND